MKVCLPLIALVFLNPLFAQGEAPPANPLIQMEEKRVPEFQLTEAETKAFVEKFDRALAANDINTINDNLFNWPLCFDLFMADLDVPKAFRFGAKLGFLQTSRTERGLFGE
ncbi:MAG: hypothetical protein KDA84_20245, partial [Planctomycetaceae bacterium]|nr:hypothetical protein [Planctomycetaceae bacterium]